MVYEGVLVSIAVCFHAFVLLVICNLNSCHEYFQDCSLYVIKGIAILDNDGNRLFAKYYDPETLSTIKEQKAFEKNLFIKTHRANAEIIMLDGLTCVYRSNVDLYFYVMGSSLENEVKMHLLADTGFMKILLSVKRQFLFPVSVNFSQRFAMSVRIT